MNMMSNEYLGRTVDHKLAEWKNDPDRKPLLLRGARQVGKSSTVKELGKQLDASVLCFYTRFRLMNFCVP